MLRLLQVFNLLCRINTSTIGKILITLPLIFLNLSETYGQFRNNNLYLGGGLSTIQQSNIEGVNLNLNYGFGNGVLVAFNFCSTFRQASNIPADYKDINWFSGANIIPQVQDYNYSLVIGENVLDRGDLGRLYLSAGAGISRITFPTNFIPSNNTGIFASWEPNYVFQTHIKTLPTFILCPVLEVPFCRYIGASLGLHYIQNKDAANVGITLNLLLGKVSAHRRKEYKQESIGQQRQ